MNWDQVVKKVIPYIVRIETPMGHGTGFLCLYNEDKSLLGIATAMHVVSYANKWQQPIRIQHNESQGAVMLKEPDRIIAMDWKTDSAVIIFSSGSLSLPQNILPLFPTGSPISIGVEVGWLGFPAIESWTLCFFSGNVSAWQAYRKAYLIDGVAINGVSGGPVVYSTETEGVQIVGIISAYQANRATGEALPGLAVAQDVSHFHDVIGKVQSMDEAKKKQQEFEKSRQNGKQEPQINKPLEGAR